MIKLEQGERVKLKSNSAFISSKVNPKVGSKYECVGVISSIEKGSGMIIVRWDNGVLNSYTKHHLMIIPEDGSDLNINSIW